MWTRRSILGLVLALVVAVGSGWATEAAAHPNESKLSKITKAKELRAGWAAYKPFAYRDNDGKLTGFAIEYVEAMAGALGVKVTWVEDQWATLVAGLVADKYAVTVNANRTWSRILVAEFTEPIAVTKKGLLIRTEDRDKIRTPADLRNPELRIASTLGDAATEAMARLYPKPQKIAFPNFADSLLGLATGKADVIGADIDLIAKVAKEHSDLYVPPDGTWFVNDLGLYVKQGDQVWLNWVNWFIRESKLDGTAEKLIEKYGLTMEVAR